MPAVERGNDLLQIGNEVRPLGEAGSQTLRFEDVLGELVCVPRSVRSGLMLFELKRLNCRQVNS